MSDVVIYTTDDGATKTLESVEAAYLKTIADLGRQAKKESRKSGGKA